MANSFSFGNIDVKSKKQSLKLEIYDNPLLVDESNVEASYDFVPVILTDEIYDDASLQAVSKFFKSNGMPRFKIVASINCKISKDEIKTDQKSGIIEFYKRNKSDFYKYIDKNAPILTVGPALYAVTLEDDIYPSHVQQIIFGKSNFWFSKDLTSENGHYIYPLESFRDIFETKKVSDKTKKPGRDGSYPLKDTGILESPRDSFKTKLAQIQIRAVAGGIKNPPRYPKLNKIFIESKEDFEEKFYLPNKDRHDEVLSWDLETSGLNITKDEIGCITLSFDGITGYYIPWKYVDKKKLGEILKNNKQLGSNLKFDIKFLWWNGVPEARIDEDVITLGHTLDETRSNTLKALAYFYSEYGGYERALDDIKAKLGKGRDINYIKDIPEDILREYAVMDAIVTKRVWINMMRHVKQLDQKYPNEICPENTIEKFYKFRRIPADNLYAGCEFRGVPVDKPMLDDLRKEMEAYADELRAKLCDAFNVPKDFNWDSSQQLGKLLEKKGWEEYGRAKSGEYLTGKFQLKRWVKVHPEAKILQELASVTTLMATFVGTDTKNSLMGDFLGVNDEESDKGWTKCMNYWPDRNMYGFNPSFASMRADSNRSRCTNPNMQQVPTRGKFTKEIKHCIMSPDDEKYYIVTLDYSSLQMRIASMDNTTQDNLKEVLSHPGADTHSNTSWNVFYGDKAVDVDIIRILQGENIKEYLGGQEVMTDRGLVFARDLTEEDNIHDFEPGKPIRIIKRTEHRPITVEEFKKQKNSAPYKSQRQTAKSLNFLLVFGGSARLFAEEALELAWTPEMVDEYLAENHCEAELAEVKAMFKHDDPTKQKYIAAATRMRDNFFKGYKGLLDRLDVQENLARKNGFVRSAFGGKRAAIELFLEGKWDEKNMSQIMSSVTRVLYNYRAQNYEAAITKRAMYEVEMWLEKNGYKSRLFSEIHDSQDMFLYKEELKPVLAHWKHVCERKIPELRATWSPLPVDCEIADRSAGDYYKGGRAPEEFGVDWDTIQFEDPDPFNVEQAPDYERDYFKLRKEYWDKKGEKDPLESEIEEYLNSKND